MKRFFNFRSAVPSSGNSSSGSQTPAALPPPPGGSEKVYWEPPWENDWNIRGDESRDASRTPNCYPEEESSNLRHLRRSLSFSSAAVYGGKGGRNLTDELSGSPVGCKNSRHRAGECAGRCHSSTPERYAGTNRGNSSAARLLDSDSRSSSANSPCSSPVPLRCRAARVTKLFDGNNTLDLYIDGEHQEMKQKKDSQSLSSDVGPDGFMVQNKVLPSTGRPPRAQSTAPSSPTYNKGNAKNYSLREVKDSSHSNGAQDWSRTDASWPASPQKQTRKNVEKHLNAFPGRTMTRLQDNDSETTATTEDIFEDPSNVQTALNSDVIAQLYSSGDIPHHDNRSDYFREEANEYQMPSHFLESGSVGGLCDNLINSGSVEHNIDDEFYQKQKEVEHMFMLLSKEDSDVEELRRNSNGLSLHQILRNITEDRRHLILELSMQIKCRVAERSSADEKFKQTKQELDLRTRRLEKEKRELQLSLEKELDRRSSNWSLKLEKFQSEEQRLRERVRELAEHNVSLQREISLLKGSEVDTRNRMMGSEAQQNNLTASLTEVRTENQELHQAFSDLQERFKEVEEERNCVRISYKEKEREDKELQKVVVRLQMICSEQEKTINGLRKGFSNELGKLSIEESDSSSRLKMEQLRLTGVEQMLRKEIESRRIEMESLRHENISLLERLQSTGNCYGFSSSKLDKELHAWVDCLQTQSLSLLSDNVYFSGELLAHMKQKPYEHGQGASVDIDGYSVSEGTIKYQNLRRKAENYKRTLQTILTKLYEKNCLEALECRSHSTEDRVSRPLLSEVLEDETEIKLKAETLLTGVLREMLFSKGQELEQLQAELASSFRALNVLRTETQRLQDELCCLTHKSKGMELQMTKKDENMHQLQHDIREYTKELTATRSRLTKVSEERHQMWEQVNHSRETIMLLNHEVSSLKKKIEVLDEDILFKEGQISILKDSVGDKPFDIICSPKPVEDFAVLSVYMVFMISGSLILLEVISALILCLVLSVYMVFMISGSLILLEVISALILCLVLSVYMVFMISGSLILLEVISALILCLVLSVYMVFMISGSLILLEVISALILCLVLYCLLFSTVI